MQEVIIEELNEGVLTLTFNRPKRKNAFNSDSWRAFTKILNAAREDEKIACVVLNGAGNNFSSGMDLSDFAEGNPDEEQPFYLAQQAIADFDKPLVAAATGIAIGGGATLLLHCDIVYVGESLRMRFPFVSLGLVPELASSYLLQASIGSRRAAELMYTAEWIDAEKALDYGIATKQFTDTKLLAATVEKAHEIAQWPVRSLQETKRCLKLAHRQAIQAAIDVERAGMDKMAGSPENIEAVMAIMEKRPANFKNLSA